MMEILQYNYYKKMIQMMNFLNKILKDKTKKKEEKQYKLKWVQTLIIEDPKKLKKKRRYLIKSQHFKCQIKEM